MTLFSLCRHDFHRPLFKAAFLSEFYSVFPDAIVTIFPNLLNITFFTITFPALW